MTISSSTQIFEINGLHATLNVWLPSSESSQLPIHFAHANGFPARSYRAMLEDLAERTGRTIYALDHRATWVDAPSVPATSFSWADAADDLISVIERVAPNGVIGVGHSLGAVVTMFAASKRPDLFKQIILIEPVLFPTRTFLAAAWIPMALRMKYIPLAKRTLQRQDVWATRAEFKDYHAAKPGFRGIVAEVMDDYAKYGLRPSSDGDSFDLTFRKTWEAHTFRSVAYPWRAFKNLKVPCIGARAELSRWIPRVSWDKWAKIHPDYPIHVLPQLDHMAPLQAPVGVSEWLASVLIS